MGSLGQARRRPAVGGGGWEEEVSWSVAAADDSFHRTRRLIPRAMKRQKRKEMPFARLFNRRCWQNWLSYPLAAIDDATNEVFALRVIPLFWARRSEG